MISAHKSILVNSRWVGFTLIELVLVLVILTVLATVVLQNLEPQVDQQRFEATQEIVNNVDSAIVRFSTSRTGERVASGFFSDMGRLPRAFTELDGDLSLRELWDASTTGLSRFQSVSAANVNAFDVAAETDSDGDPVFADRQVSVSLGWRGPYLFLPVGSNQVLRDGWGNELVSDGQYSHLRTIDEADADADSNVFEEQDVLIAGQDVFGVRSLGRGDTITIGSAADPFQDDLPEIVEDDSRLRLSREQLQGVVTGLVFVQTPVGTPEPTNDQIVVQIYYPDTRGNGEIRVETAMNEEGPVAEINRNAALSTPDNLEVFDFRFLDSEDDAVEDGEIAFPIGSRVMRAYFLASPDTSGDYGDGISDPSASIPVRFELQPTNNAIDLTIN